MAVQYHQGTLPPRDRLWITDSTFMIHKPRCREWMSHNGPLNGA
jgi:hypothetical protein